MESRQYTSRFDRIAERDILAETADECRSRLYQESIGKPVVYTEAEVAQMKRARDRWEKEQKAQEDWRQEARRLLMELAA